MTVNEVITLVDSLKRNQYTNAMKIKWLQDLDTLIYNDIISIRDGNECEVPEDYDTSTELIVPSPYDSIYRYKLEAEIDYANAEMKKYDNSSTMFNEALSAFRNYYNKNHMILFNPKINTEGRTHMASQDVNRLKNMLDEIEV